MKLKRIDAHFSVCKVRQFRPEDFEKAMDMLAAAGYVVG